MFLHLLRTDHRVFEVATQLLRRVGERRDRLQDLLYRHIAESSRNLQCRDSILCINNRHDVIEGTASNIVSGKNGLHTFVLAAGLAPALSRVLTT